MKVTITKEEAKAIVKKHIESIFPSTEVEENIGAYGDFEFDVTEKDNIPIKE